MTDRTDIRLFKEGEIVISEGRTNKEMYKIVSGKAAVYFDYKKSSEYLVGVLGDTRCFGEIGLLTGKPSPFTVVAVTDLMLLGIGEDDFELFVSEEPRNAVDIMRNLAMMVFTMGFNVNNVSSITAFRQLLFQSPQRGLWKALKIRFQRHFKADTFLDVKLIPPCGRTKVQGKFVYFRIFLALLQP